MAAAAVAAVAAMAAVADLDVRISSLAPAVRDRHEVLQMFND